MIQATELRIGNYLTYRTPDDTDMPCKIDAQDILNISTNYMHNAEIHSPIPLTEEILLKSGFEKDYEGHFLLAFNGRLYYYDLENGFLLKDFKVKTKLNQFPFYNLHQLQNLIHALTNTELNNITL